MSNVDQYQPIWIQPNIDHSECCRGDDLRHEAVSELPIPFTDGHACVDCCPCGDCGGYRAEQFIDDPGAWTL